ncbi:uncharacterized protein LOC112086636 [Eutrema salsugineum]|uniref:uncharacterized protein LOC112086636 n=1 Tax=Eutrema salsugineum TaxID=72664 RepID=UPI000CED6B03|nr:uncharacterized protein LOC112086636 [Eutrema salsugineum]
MWAHWDTPDAIERSSTASQCRNSNLGRLGVHKHVFGQKSHLTVQQEMEEALGRLVSLGEVFMKTYTRADGTFVDRKAEKVAQAYEKNLEELVSQLDVDGLDTSENSSQQSTHRTLTVEEKDDIFLKMTRDTLMDLAQLERQSPGKKRKDTCYASSSSSILEMQEQLKAARQKIAEQEAEYSRRDEEAQAAQKHLELLFSYVKNKDPVFPSFLASQANTTAATTSAATTSTAAPANATAPAPATAQTNEPAPTPAALSNDSSPAPNS